MSVELLGKALGPLEGQVKSNLEKQEGLIVGIQQNSDEYFGKKNTSTDTLSRRDQMMRQRKYAHITIVVKRTCNLL